MPSIIEKLSENLQLIYRKAIDADETITRLRNDGKGKFVAIFAADAGFTQQSKFFKPYVEELAKDISELDADDLSQQKTELASIVKKMEMLLATLAQFQQSFK
jgi:hypothetical protein